MEMKWFMIGGAVAFIAMFGSLAVSQSAKYDKESKCLTSYAMSERSADEIKQICR